MDFSKLESDLVLPGFLKSSVETLVDQRIERLISSGRIMASPERLAPRLSLQRPAAASNTDFLRESVRTPRLSPFLRPLKTKTFGPPKSFKFEKLPTELRLQIWEHTMPGPRVVEIDVELSCPKGQRSCTYTSRTAIPILLHVHRESREFGRKCYQLSFACHHDKRYRGAPTVWSNFDIDTFYFRPIKVFGEVGVITVTNIHHINYLMSDHQMGESITRLAIPIQFADDSKSFITALNLSKLPNLAELILVGDEIKSTILEANQNPLTVENNRVRLVQAGALADSSWARMAAGLRSAFVDCRNRNMRKKAVSQPNISIRLLVRD